MRYRWNWPHICLSPSTSSLNIELLLQTRLMPLRYVDATVRQEFAQTMRELELFVVEPYLSRPSMHALGGSVFSSSRAAARDGQQVLETYYPFDPVRPGFQACAARLHCLYNVWTDAAPIDANVSGVSAASDDFITSHVSDNSNATPRSLGGTSLRGLGPVGSASSFGLGGSGAIGNAADRYSNMHRLALSRSISGQPQAHAASLSPL